MLQLCSHITLHMLLSWLATCELSPPLAYPYPGMLGLSTYDGQFRTMAACNPHLQWDQRHPDLWHETMTSVTSTQC